MLKQKCSYYNEKQGERHRPEMRRKGVGGKDRRREKERKESDEKMKRNTRNKTQGSGHWPLYERCPECGR
jgi:hypothetical protein